MSRGSACALRPLDRRAFCGGVAAGALALAAPAARAATDYNTQIGWRDGRDGLAEAARTFRPSFMVVHARWCPACRQYSSLFHDPRVVAALADFVPVLVDADHDPVARRYQPDGSYIPRSLVLSDKGEHLADVTGPYDHRYFLPPRDADYLLDFLERGLASARGEGLVAGRPERKPAPADSESLGPSFSRPGEGTPTLRGGADPGTGGPKRMRVPQASAAPAPRTASPAPTLRTAPALQPAPVETLQPAAPLPAPGLIDRLLGLFS